jgi:iron(III) transport system substrate-binding protein
MHVARRDFVRGVFAIGLAAGSTNFLGCRKRSADSEVVVYCSVDESFAAPILHDFELDKGIKVQAVYNAQPTKSATFFDKLSSGGNADVFWSVDPVRPFQLIRKGLVEAYRTPSAEGIPSDYKAADGTWTGFAARARVLLVNKAKLGGAPSPRSIRDLAKDSYRGKVAIANPLFGSPSMHVAALSVVWGFEETKRFLASLRTNQVRIENANEDVQRLVQTGEMTFGLVDTDDAHEAMQSGAPVEVVYPDQEDLGTLVMPTSVVALSHASHTDATRKMIDYLTSAEVENHLADSAAHIPLRAGSTAPASVRPLSSLRSMRVDYAMVADEMDKIEPWLKQWVAGKA